MANKESNLDVLQQPCVDFLRKLSNVLNLEFHVECPANELKPVVVISWIGSEPDWPSIMLNSHMDVVPVFEEFWIHKPFDADIDNEGRIFARGSQDMKCVGMQYLAAIRSLKDNNVKLKRSVHCTFVPDEENFGPDGLKSFIQTETFRKMNVGFTLDEGIASPTDVFNVFYAERSCWQAIFKVGGTPGHGSLLLPETAGEKLRILLDKIFDFRLTQEEILNKNPELLLGDITTMNVTKMNGGKQRNVLPPVIEVCVDIRLAVTEDHNKFDKMLIDWCTECGRGVELSFGIKEAHIPPTKIDDSNIYWKAFEAAFNEMKLKMKTQVFPAGTDASYVRFSGIPAIGFSPMIETPILLHSHNEFLHADMYLQGIEIYKNIIRKIANCM